MANKTQAEIALEALMKQQEDLAAKITAHREASRAEALETARSLCKNYEITATELKGFIKVTRTKSTTTARKKSSRKK